MVQTDHLLHVAAESVAIVAPAPDLWQLYGVDIVSFVISLLLLIVYYAYTGYRTRKDPTFTVQAVNMIARAEWVDSVMREPGKEVLAVQTFRNSTMAATLMASTAVFLIVGVLTLSSHGDELQGTWHVLNIAGSTRSEMWMVKLLIMLLDLLVAFFSFSMAVRVFNHVGYMINVPLKRNHKSLQPENVARHLNRAGSFFSLGMRAYYFGVPLMFWLFNPLFMMLSSVALVIVLYWLDRTPASMAGDLAEETKFLKSHETSHRTAS